MATPVIMPRQGQSVESCILVDWQVKPGDAVEQGAVLADIETDKAVFEVEAPEAGTVLELFFEPGDDIPVLTNIAALGEAGEDATDLRPGSAPASAAPAAEAAAATPAPEATARPAATPSATGTSTGVSPRARGLAAGQGIATEEMTGTGPGGRVIERDVQRAIAEGPRLSPAALDARAAGAGLAPSVGSGPGGMVLQSDLITGAAMPSPVPGAAGVDVPVDGIRRIIAERMHASLATTAQLTLNRSFDATAVLAYRKQVKAHGEKFGLPNITINDIIAFAVVRCLKLHPALNAHWLGDRIVQHDRVNLGIAMDTPRGLMVPVVQGADGLSLRTLSEAIKPMAEAAQSGGINPDLLRGGTFTITNLGTLGIEQFTPILNAPEVGILGVGGLFLKPVPAEGGVGHVQAINLSLTIDHQAVDGAPGARFLQDLAASLESFDLTLAG